MTGFRKRVQAFETSLIRTALLRHGGHRLKAARELGIGRSFLYRLMARYGIAIAPAHPRKARV